ncbi:MAG: DASH family cryptochrome [Deltaproteobacteria bacterium]
MRIKIGIVWFRHDLRLRDNQALTEAAEQCDVILPVYVFDERLYNEFTPNGFRQIGVYRAQFIIDSVNNLKKSLHEKNIDLIVRFGKAEDIICEIADQVKSTIVFCNRERAPEEEIIQDNLEKKLWHIGQELRFSRGKMLYHTGDLPFPVRHTPDTYAAFYREVGKIVPVRKPLPVPDKMLPYMGTVESDPVPSLTELGFSEDEIPKEGFRFKGGESEGLKKLDEFIKSSFKVNSLKINRKNKDEVLITHLSPYINAGVLSPKTLYESINQYMGNKYHASRASCILHGLMRRDFMKLLEKKYKTKIFEHGGIKGNEQYELKPELEKFQLWREARTGIPIVDAFMRELNNTGYISYEGRRILSQFLIEELCVTWQLGAEYFQSKLVDYNPCSNWGNWNIMAGVAFDTKEDRYCSIITKARKLDPKGEFVRKWVPELAPLNDSYIHEPEKANPAELEKINFELGKDYPLPIVDTEKWV